MQQKAALTVCLLYVGKGMHVSLLGMSWSMQVQSSRRQLDNWQDPDGEKRFTKHSLKVLFLCLKSPWKEWINCLILPVVAYIWVKLASEMK